MSQILDLSKRYPKQSEYYNHYANGGTMSRSKQYRRKPYEYERILEILEAYWLSEPDEELVVVEMYFRKKDGQEQAKRICWRNPER